MASEGEEFREDLRAIVRKHDPDPDTLRHVADDLTQLADRFEDTNEVL